VKVRNVLLAFVILFALVAAPVMAEATTFTNNYSIPFELTQWVPCAADGAGEEIHLTGVVHVLEHYTLDGRGGFHVKMHYQPQGLSGLGLTTGDKYQGTGVTQDTENGQVGRVYTFVNNYRMIGQGPGNNFLLHETFHYTISANGELTAYVDKWSVECK
jgi:hypothetical protein